MATVAYCSRAVVREKQSAEGNAVINLEFGGLVGQTVWKHHRVTYLQIIFSLFLYGFRQNAHMYIFIHNYANP
jgi:hypothetical protein